MVGCCRLLDTGILCSCSCPPRSDHSVPINLQQDKYSLFCNFLSLYEWKSIMWKRQEHLEWATLYFPGYKQHYFRRDRVSMTKHRQQSTKVRDKRINSIQIQVCSSCLHIYMKNRSYSFTYWNVYLSTDNSWHIKWKLLKNFRVQ